MADRNYLDPQAWRSDMDAPSPNYLSPATLKPGPAPTGYEKLFDVVYNYLGGRPENRWAAEKLATAFDVGTLGMATGAYDGGAHLARTGEAAPLALALMPAAKVVQPIEIATRKGASAVENMLARNAGDAILASRNEAGHLPPAQPQRAFTDDYRKAPAGHPGSQLEADIDGRPLNARFVAGRRTVGGDDEPLGIDAIEDLARELASRVTMVPRSDLPKRAVGTYDPRTSAIKIADDLDGTDKHIALTHELGHAITSWPSNVDFSKHEKAARRIYHDLAYGRPAKVKSEIRDPEYYGYKKSEVPDELWAEATRAYMQDPNYIKTVAPALAKEIRKLNDVKGLRDILQFNTPMAGLGVGLGAAATWPGEDTR